MVRVLCFAEFLWAARQACSCASLPPAMRQGQWCRVLDVRLVMCLQAGDEVNAEAKPKVDAKEEVKPEVSMASLLVLQVLCSFQAVFAAAGGQVAAIRVLVLQRSSRCYKGCPHCTCRSR